MDNPSILFTGFSFKGWRGRRTPYSADRQTLSAPGLFPRPPRFGPQPAPASSHFDGVRKSSHLLIKLKRDWRRLGKLSDYPAVGDSFARLHAADKAGAGSQLAAVRARAEEFKRVAPACLMAPH
jgi:hypothetical protein